MRANKLKLMRAVLTESLLLKLKQNIAGKESFHKEKALQRNQQGFFFRNRGHNPIKNPPILSDLFGYSFLKGRYPGTTAFERAIFYKSFCLIESITIKSLYGPS